ncbi:hypothetical protein QBC46DRAFT_343143 [Diplogelasinospora grovesii]|uniref:Uncharacterized protein n=1 Tax=Diplogelasinospora grovesii TaxID=303347 RepID=A0AAN6S379_9PEZI|nr:hypothetical protein QBC46DRAFT_343143 [Diplogelasinospora grovesii]
MPSSKPRVINDIITCDSLLSNEICLAAEHTRLDYQKGTVEEAKKASETLGKQVGLAAEAFKKASDEFPSGWDIIGQQIVSGLADAATAALNAAVSLANPLAKFETGANIVGDFIHGGKNDKTGHGTSAPSQGQAAQPNPQGAVPKHLYDPAYTEIQKASIYLAALQIIVSGKNSGGNIDWEKARGDTGGAKSSVKFLSTMLSDAKTRFSSLATAAEPSVTLTGILDVTSRIASEIEAEVKKSKNIVASCPAKDSEQVKKWQSDWAAQYRAANTLLATAKTIPGASANGVPLMASPDPAQRTAQINAKTTQAQALLEAAKNRLSTTQQMLTDAQENYVKTTEMLLEQQNKLGEIQASLSKLTAANISLAEIKRILIECIKLIINLKQQITNLVRFFKAMASVVEMCVKFHVEPFLDTVKAIVAADGTDPHKELKIGDFTFTDFQRSQVFSATVTLRSYFSVFGDIAKMWVDLSKENVLPGLRLCDEMSTSVDTINDPGEMKRRVAVLERWSREAADRVSKVARGKQAEILNGMEGRIQDIKETTRQIEPPPEEARKAIAAGTEVTKDAAHESIQSRAKSSPLSRFVITDDD